MVQGVDWSNAAMQTLIALWGEQSLRTAVPLPKIKQYMKIYTEGMKK